MHEPPDLPEVRHIHADPHFRETLDEATGDREWDVVLGLYGRLRTVARAFAGRCGHFVGVGGVPVYRGFLDPEDSRPHGMAVLAREDGPLADAYPPVSPFAGKIVEAEREVFAVGAAGGYAATMVRYSQIYGPRNIVPWEWAVIRRIADGRRRMILPDNGLWLISRCAARNAAEVLLKVVDSPGTAAGEAFNVADDDQQTTRQWVQRIVALLGAELEIVGIPAQLAPSAMGELLAPTAGPHVLVDATKAKRLLGYHEVVSADVALAETVDWLRANPPTATAYPAYNARFDYAQEDRLIAAWEQACAHVLATAPEQPLETAHAMPHPKVPASPSTNAGAERLVTRATPR
ncbi:NAD-dependent epimerase/dehydratase family protein [Nocardioides humi]|uniref:NAD-dependent epimerase/dehydratase family protein n=1 Tax=Nocardioides humi TaxID=449461 RepID=UPI001C6447C3|nr:NAD-dependent epimerase/dehydratase family protein [Nocardioides humi]